MSDEYQVIKYEVLWTKDIKKSKKNMVFHDGFVTLSRFNGESRLLNQNQQLMDKTFNIGAQEFKPDQEIAFEKHLARIGEMLTVETEKRKPKLDQNGLAKVSINANRLPVNEAFPRHKPIVRKPPKQDGDSEVVIEKVFHNINWFKQHSSSSRRSPSLGPKKPIPSTQGTLLKYIKRNTDANTTPNLQTSNFQHESLSPTPSKASDHSNKLGENHSKILQKSSSASLSSPQYDQILQSESKPSDSTKDGAYDISTIDEDAISKLDEAISSDDGDGFQVSKVLIKSHFLKPLQSKPEKTTNQRKKSKQIIRDQAKNKIHKISPTIPRRELINFSDDDDDHDLVDSDYSKHINSPLIKDKKKVEQLNDSEQRQPKLSNKGKLGISKKKSGSESHIQSNPFLESMANPKSNVTPTFKDTVKRQIGQRPSLLNRGKTTIEESQISDASVELSSSAIISKPHKNLVDTDLENVQFSDSSDFDNAVVASKKPVDSVKTLDEAIDSINDDFSDFSDHMDIDEAKHRPTVSSNLRKIKSPVFDEMDIEFLQDQQQSVEKTPEKIVTTNEEPIKKVEIFEKPKSIWDPDSQDDILSEILEEAIKTPAILTSDKPKDQKSLWDTDEDDHDLEEVKTTAILDNDKTANEKSHSEIIKQEQSQLNKSLDTSAVTNLPNNFKSQDSYWDLDFDDSPEKTLLDKANQIVETPISLSKRYSNVTRKLVPSNKAVSDSLQLSNNRDINTLLISPVKSKLHPTTARTSVKRMKITKKHFEESKAVINENFRLKLNEKTTTSSPSKIISLPTKNSQIIEEQVTKGVSYNDIPKTPSKRLGTKPKGFTPSPTKPFIPHSPSKSHRSPAKISFPSIPSIPVKPNGLEEANFSTAADSSMLRTHEVLEETPLHNEPTESTNPNESLLNDGSIDYLSPQEQLIENTKSEIIIPKTPPPDSRTLKKVTPTRCNEVIDSSPDFHANGKFAYRPKPLFNSLQTSSSTVAAATATTTTTTKQPVTPTAPSLTDEQLDKDLEVALSQLSHNSPELDLELELEPELDSDPRPLVAAKRLGSLTRKHASLKQINKQFTMPVIARPTNKTGDKRCTDEKKKGDPVVVGELGPWTKETLDLFEWKPPGVE